jgi:hypothetical protein
MACHSGKGWSLRLRGEREAKARAFAYAGEREAKAGAFAYALLLNVALDNHFAALKLVV